MKKLLSAALIVLLAANAAIAAEPAAASESEKTFPGNSTSTVTIGEFMENPKLKPILDKHLPGFSSNGQVGMARGMTLRSIQAYSPDTLTDEALGKIDADVATLPAR